MTTELNRRCVLIGLAAASGAAASASAGETSQLSESPELLDLANGLPQVEAKYWTAKNKVDAIVKEVRHIWPNAPEQIFVYIGYDVPEVDIEGSGIKRTLTGRGKSPLV